MIGRIRYDDCLHGGISETLNLARVIEVGIFVGNRL